MPPRDGRNGAEPIAELARLDSDMHHLRDQTDTDRRTEAAFRVETREQLQRIDAAQSSTAGQLMRVTDLVNRLDVSTTAHSGHLNDIRLELAYFRGSLKVVAAIAAAVPILIEVAKHLAK